MKLTRCAAALAAAAMLSLAACGGGGGDGAQPVVVIPESPSLSSSEIKAELNALIDRSDTIIEEHSHHIYFGPQREARSLRHPLDLRDIDCCGEFVRYSVAADGDYEFGGEENGLAVAAALWDSTGEVYGSPPRQAARVHFSFGAWMEHSFFLVMETVYLDPLDDYVSVYPDIFSIGAASGTNPVEGSATWLGVMVGVDEDFAGDDISRVENSEWNVYGGTAAVTLTDFGNPMVDVSFTEITNLASERSIADVSWQDLPVTEGGFEGRGILGRFYGLQHEEVGGGFQFDAINGAFGAERE